MLFLPVFPSYGPLNPLWWKLKSLKSIMVEIKKLSGLDYDGVLGAITN